MCFRAVGALIACVLLVVSATASAWTSAQVHDVRARVVVSPSGEATVLLDLGIDVRGGWLERFDLEGLSPELALDPDRPGWLMTAEGSVVAGRVTTYEGAVTLRFDKRDAARRGQHRLLIAYRAPLYEGSSEQRWAFVLPGFQQTIGEAEVVLDVPKGVRAVRDPDSTTEVRERTSAERVELTFRRTHWPRATPWTVEIERDAAPQAAAKNKRGQRRAFTGGALLASCLLALGLLARASFRRSARRLGLQTEPWLPFPRARPWFTALCALGMALSWPFALAWSLGFGLCLSLCCTERVVASTTSPRLGCTGILGATGLRRARLLRLREWFGDAPWADASTFLGALGISSLVAAAMLAADRAPEGSEPWSLGLLCALPGWVASSRVRLPRSATERLHRLLTLASKLRVQGCALRLISHLDARGALVEARLRVLPATRYAGLLRVDVCADSRRFVRASSLSVIVRRGSLVDRWLQDQFAPHERSLSAGGLRVAYVRSVEDPDSALDQLFAHLSRESQAVLQKQGFSRAA